MGDDAEKDVYMAESEYDNDKDEPIDEAHLSSSRLRPGPGKTKGL